MRDFADVKAMVSSGLIECERMLEFFFLIEPELIRYPALDPKSFRMTVEQFCQEQPDS